MDGICFSGWLEHIILDYSEYGSIQDHIDREKYTHTRNIHSATSRSSEYNTRMLYVVSLICYTISCVYMRIVRRSLFSHEEEQGMIL